MRLLADAPVSDLAVVDERELLDFKRKTVRESAEHLRAVRVRRITEEQARHRKERRRSRGESVWRKMSLACLAVCFI